MKEGFNIFKDLFGRGVKDKNVDYNPMNNQIDENADYFSNHARIIDNGDVEIYDDGFIPVTPVIVDINDELLNNEDPTPIAVFESFE